MDKDEVVWFFLIGASAIAFSIMIGGLAAYVISAVFL